MKLLKNLKFNKDEIKKKKLDNNSEKYREGKLKRTQKGVKRTKNRVI